MNAGNQTITIEFAGESYTISPDDKTALACVAALRHVEAELKVISATLEAFERAKSGYLVDLKSEIIRLRTGVEI